MVTDKQNEISAIKQKELRSASIKLRDDGIMEIKLKPSEDFSVNDLKEINKEIDLLGEGKAYPNLILIDHFFNADKDVRAYSATEESCINTIADAFVVKMLAVSFIGNFYISFNKPPRPSQIFNSEEEAVKWLKTFL